MMALLKYRDGRSRIDQAYEVEYEGMISVPPERAIADHENGRVVFRLIEIRIKNGRSIAVYFEALPPTPRVAACPVA